MFSDFESFYIRRVYFRICDCWNRPITGTPGRYVKYVERETHDYNKSFVYVLSWSDVRLSYFAFDRFTGRVRELLNLSSYNYLGFAENSGPCIDEDIVAVRKYGIGTCSPRMEVGTQEIHRELEQVVARFVGKEDSITVPMGFAANSTMLAGLVGKVCTCCSGY